MPQMCAVQGCEAEGTRYISKIGLAEVWICGGHPVERKTMHGGVVVNRVQLAEGVYAEYEDDPDTKMEMAEPTPGLWILSNARDPSYIWVERADGGGLQWIAIVPNHEDARLMTLSPQMFDLLRRIHNALPDCMAESCEVGTPMMIELDQLIARATGTPAVEGK